MSAHERQLWANHAHISRLSDRAFVAGDGEVVATLTAENLQVLKQIEAIQRRRFWMRSVVALCTVAGILAALLVPSC